MRLTDTQIKKRMGVKQLAGPAKKGVQQAVFISKAAFYESEADDFLSNREFLYMQSKFIQKRWWLLQGLILSVLWGLLQLPDSSASVQRYFGVSAPLFAVLILPELWKNKSFHAMEIECASYFSLRQVYAAKLFLFALADFLLLFVFSFAGILTGKFLFREIMIPFFLPYSVTSCICFRTLYSSKINSELSALFLCIIWSGIWIYLVLDKNIYDRIAQPVWFLMTVLSVFYLGYCIWRGQKQDTGIFQEYYKRSH